MYFQHTIDVTHTSEKWCQISSLNNFKTFVYIILSNPIIMF